jgi:predicted site-specific integrase-resolvase
MRYPLQNHLRGWSGNGCIHCIKSQWFPLDSWFLTPATTEGDLVLLPFLKNIEDCGKLRQYIHRAIKTYRMKLSDYAKSQGVSYRTAWSWWKKGIIKGRQLPTGTILVETDAFNDSVARVRAPASLSVVACIYARVSSCENKDNLERQAERLTQYAAAKGYAIHKVVKEVGSGLNDNRKKLNQILSDRSFTVLIVEHKDRLTRFGANYIEILLSETDRRLEVVNGVADDKEDLMSDESRCNNIMQVQDCTE